MFSIIYDGGVKEYRHFFLFRRDNGYLHFASRLLGVTLQSTGIHPIYLPIFTASWRQKQLYFEIHLSRWKSLILLLGRQRFDVEFFDLRSEYD